MRSPLTLGKASLFRRPRSALLTNPVSSFKATLNGVAFYIKSNYKKDEVTADARQSLAIPSPQSELLTNPVSSFKATPNGVAFYIKLNYKKDEVTADARQSGGADSLPGLIHRLQKSCLPL